MAYRISHTHAAGTGHAKVDTAVDALHKAREFDQRGFHVRIIDEHNREYNLAAFAALHGGPGEPMPKSGKAAAAASGGPVTMLKIVTDEIDDQTEPLPPPTLVPPTLD